MIVLAGVLLASLLGSVHCAAMCSAFACLANGGGRRGAFYHGGRLVAYLLLGTLAGLVGVGLDRAGLVASMQRTAALVTSLALIGWGLVQLRQALRATRAISASPWAGTLARLLHRTSLWDPRARATAIGLTTGLLPCGWLWAFVATAMGTGSPARGALVMLVFWAGTVPMLVAVAAGARRWGPVARVRWPLASASLVVTLGFGQLATHLFMPPMTAATADTVQATAHVHRMAR